MQLLPFQEEHVGNLTNSIVKTLNEKISLTNQRKAERKNTFLLVAPTGSGKTLMLSEICKSLNNAFILVLSPGAGNLEEQTRNSLKKYLSGTSLTVNDIDSTILNNPAVAGSVYVKNWESLCGTRKDTGEFKNILARNSEGNNIFDWITATVSSGVPLVIMIDEAHYGKDTAASSIKKFLDKIDKTVLAAAQYTPIVIEATATPAKDKKGNLITAEDSYVVEEKITYEEVIDAGLIRKSVILNDGLEDIENMDEMDAETILLEAAYQRSLKIDEAYTDAGSKYHSLIGIQIPASNLGSACRKRVKEFFSKKGITVENGQLAEYFSEEKTDNLENIYSSESPVKVLIYKQAIAMGWDCPRAQILVGFRHIKSQSFSVQNLGRFLRTTEAKHYTIADTVKFEELNNTYVYSNEYTKNIFEQNQENFNGNIDIRKKETLNEFYKDVIDEYNSYNLPVSTVVRKTKVEIDRGEISRIINDVADEFEFSFDSEKTIDDEVLSSGELDSYNFDLNNIQIEIDQNSSFSTKFSNAEIDERFLILLKNVLRLNDVDQYATVAAILMPRIPRLKGIKNYMSGNDYEIKRIMLHPENSAKLQEFIEEVLKDDYFDNDDFAIPESSAYVKGSVGNYLPTEIFVKERSGGYGGELAKMALYHEKLQGGYYARGIDQSERSKPEKNFENNILKFNHLSDSEKGKINSDFSLVMHYKNPPFVTDGGFRIGLQFSVKYEEGGKKKLSNFFPDHLLFIKDNSTGKIFPVVVEIKDEKGGQNSESLLNAKAKAAETYMENTGLPFVVLSSDKSGTKFTVYGKKQLFEEFLAAVAKDLSIKTFDRNTDISWVENLGR